MQLKHLFSIILVFAFTSTAAAWPKKPCPKPEPKPEPKKVLEKPVDYKYSSTQHAVLASTLSLLTYTVAKSKGLSSQKSYLLSIVSAVAYSSFLEHDQKAKEKRLETAAIASMAAPALVFEF